ncbi:MAG: DUF4388 domain-containing protein [Cyanobacteria bacterium SZAS-4]|nr:DUF4388 domain-containing protein [Cyanobacteria bacterium SZAS-4]
MIGRPKPGSSRLNTAPNEARLRQLLADATKNSSAQVTWDHPTHEMIYTLTVMVSTMKERRGWERGKTGDMVAPEWCLYEVRENGKDRQDLWRMASGDIAIIQNLLEDSLRTASRPAESAHEAVSSPRDSYSRVSGSAPAPQWGGFDAPAEASISQTMQTDRASSGVNLSGELKEVDVASILQSISLCKMTGRLNVYDSMQQVEIFFNQGELVHAISSPLMDISKGIRGEKVLLEVFTWDDGSFQFQHGWQTAERSVQKHLQNLVLEGATLQDYKNSLEKNGIFLGTTLFRKETNLTELQFESKLANGLPMHIDLQKKVFLALREPKTLQEILDAVPMDRTTWIPVIYSLVSSMLIAARGVVVGDDGQFTDAFSNIGELIRNADRGLIQPDSGMLSYGLFLSFADKELARRVPCCLAMFEFNVPPSSITNESLKAITTTFDAMKHPYECMTFWQPNRVLILLPMAKIEETTSRLNSFLDSLSEKIDMDGISLVGGLAAAPKDGTQLADVLTSSYKLLKKAQQSNSRIACSS